MKIVVIGGGWAGCAAAAQAAKMGAEAILLERTDMLLGTGLVGGIMRNNGRFTATEELIALGGGEIFKAIDDNFLHQDISFPGHDHASLYNVATMEPIIRGLLQRAGVQIHFQSRVVDAETDGETIQAVVAKDRVTGEALKLTADVFVEATGTAGGPANCSKYGNGCAMCVLRCHSFGGRVSLAAKAGIKEMRAVKGGQVGAFSGSCKLLKESLDPAIKKELDRKGVVVAPLPEELVVGDKLAIKACQQYALPEFGRNLVLLDTGHAKLMTPFFPLEALRMVPGFEKARYEDPYAGGLGNSVRYLGMSPRDNSLKVTGLANLFCAGEKTGPFVGHTEAICTGVLAGCNAVRTAAKAKPLVLPDSLAIGDAVSYVQNQIQTEQGLALKFTFSGSVLFERLKQKGLYSTNKNEIRKRVASEGLEDAFNIY
ncbi:MAG: FAD-dependent oxidoreductase [Desulfarculaceae bacterium]|jgi:hypothetical protein